MLSKSKPLRFLIVQNSIKTTYLFRRDYLKRLVKLGNVYVLAPNDSESHKEKLVEMGINVYFIPNMDSFSAKIKAIIIMNYYIVLERLRGSVVVSHFLVTFLFCYLSMIPFNKKLIIYTEGLGTLFTNNKIARLVLKFLIQKNSSLRLFCNESERELIGKPHDVVTHGIGIDLHEFNLTKKQFKTDEQAYRLLYIGRLIADKGVNDAISVFEELKSKGYNVILSLIGDIYPNNPSSLSPLQLETLKNSHGDSIEIVGFTDDVKSWYAQSDILLLPSMREGFPVVVMEASGMGIPTVGYNVPGVKDAVINNINGMLVPYKELSKLIEETERLLCRSVLSKFHLSATTYASANFSNIDKSESLVKMILQFSRPMNRSTGRS